MRTAGAATQCVVWTLICVTCVRTQQAGETTLDPSGPGADTTDPNGPECQCVPYHQCTEGGVVYENDKTSRCSSEKAIDVCCKTASLIAEEKPVVTTPSTRVGCGRRYPEGLGLTTVGSDAEAQYGEFPWMVAILAEKVVNGTNVDVYTCGASLIHPQVVLTAAHCVSNKSADKVKIRAGEWDSNTENELFPHQDRLVSQIILHEGFVARTAYNDIALLILQDPVTPAENVDVVCLPSAGQNFDDSQCVVSGWGKGVWGKEGGFVSIMKKVDVPIVPRTDCVKALRKTRLGRWFQLHESFICAGGERNDVCRGDGGGPLVCHVLNDPLQEHYQQVGVVSWGIGCGEAPGVYTDVSHMRNWIDGKMILNNLGTSPYTFPDP